jgi:chemotaxis protein CheZ
MSASKIYNNGNARAENTLEAVETQRHAEILEAITSLRQHAKPTFEANQILMEERQHDLVEVRRLKLELHAIAEAIQRTKQEIATLHYAGAQGREMARVTDELGAVVLGTETATHSILAAAEEIDDLAGNLASRLSGQENQLARQIGERIISIFEACNFQDITGQRIGKVVSAMRFVEERVSQMIEIWGGHERFKDVPTARDLNREGDRALLNGPGLEADGDSKSQDDIDAYFK